MQIIFILGWYHSRNEEFHLYLMIIILKDYHYFPFKNDSMVAVFIHLDDSDIENGGLAVFSGSHKLGPQENVSDVPTHFYVSQVN